MTKNSESSRKNRSRRRPNPKRKVDLDIEKEDDGKSTFGFDFCYLADAVSAIWIGASVVAIFGFAFFIFFIPFICALLSILAHAKNNRHYYIPIIIIHCLVTGSAIFYMFLSFISWTMNIFELGVHFETFMSVFWFSLGICGVVFLAFGAFAYIKAYRYLSARKTNSSGDPDPDEDDDDEDENDDGYDDEEDSELENLRRESRLDVIDEEEPSPRPSFHEYRQRKATGVEPRFAPKSAMRRSTGPVVEQGVPVTVASPPPSYRSPEISMDNGHVVTTTHGGGIGGDGDGHPGLGGSVRSIDTRTTYFPVGTTPAATSTDV